MTSTETNLPSKIYTCLLNNKLKFKSIKTKLTVIIVLMLLISGTVLTGIAALMASNALEQSSIDTLRAVGEGTSEKLWLVTDMGKDLTSILAVDPDAISMLVRLEGGDTVDSDVTDHRMWTGEVTLEEQLDLSFYFEEFQAGLSTPISMLAVYNNNGIIMASSVISFIGRDDSNQEFFNNQQKGAYIGKPFLDGGVPVIPYAQPLYDENGTQIGLAFVGHMFSGFDSVLFTTPGLSDESTNFLVGPDGTILSGVKGDYSPFLTKKFDLRIFPPGENLVKAPGYFGRMAYIVKTPVPGTNWSIITTETVNAVNGPITSLVTTMIISLIIVIVAGVIAAVLIANGFTRPILALTDNAKQLALGDIDVVITHTGNDEIGQLADSFRRMVENMKQKVNSVQKIASGNINFELITFSDIDAEGNALIQMKRNLTYMVKSLDTLAQRSAEGDLSYRADASKFQGVYRELIATLNHAFDLIICPVQETMRLSQSYNSGDYADRFDPHINVNGDFIAFRDALNQIGINTSEALFTIRNGIHDINLGASYSSTSIEEIANAVSTLAESSAHVSSLADRNDTGLEQALIAMNDLADTVGNVSQRTASVSRLVSQSSDLSHDGVKRAELAGQGMEEIITSFETTSEAISAISSQMKDIGGIVDVISGIAEQTSLIALNAAIEAARAGDSGRGFAVVADEVKSLAQESQISAEHISSIIGNLQKMSDEMTAGMEKSNSLMRSGSNAVNETIIIFQQMDEAIADINKNMSEVAAASEEQAASVQEITASMNEVRTMVQDTTREATDSAAAAEEISASLDGLKETAVQSLQLAEIIQEQIGRFNIEW